MIRELSLDLYIKDKNGKKYRDSNFEQIEKIHHKIIKTEFTDLEKHILQKYDIYESILKEGSSIFIEVSEPTKFRTTVLYTYDGNNIIKF